MEHTFICGYEACRAVSQVDLSDRMTVEAIRDQEGTLQQYLITCPCCKVRQAVEAWRVHETSS